MVSTHLLFYHQKGIVLPFYVWLYYFQFYNHLLLSEICVICENCNGVLNSMLDQPDGVRNGPPL